jgi:hypothetical protein
VHLEKAAMSDRARAATICHRMLTAVIVMVSIGGCALLGGDRMFRVSGVIPVDGANTEQCSLEQMSANGHSLSTQPVDRSFSTTTMIVVGRHPHSVYFIARCTNGRTYQSKTVEVSSVGRSAGRIDLGTFATQYEHHP